MRRGRPRRPAPRPRRRRQPAATATTARCRLWLGDRRHRRRGAGPVLLRRVGDGRHQAIAQRRARRDGLSAQPRARPPAPMSSRASACGWSQVARCSLIARSSSRLEGAERVGAGQLVDLRRSSSGSSTRLLAQGRLERRQRRAAGAGQRVAQLGERQPQAAGWPSPAPRRSARRPRGRCSPRSRRAPRRGAAPRAGSASAARTSAAEVRRSASSQVGFGPVRSSERSSASSTSTLTRRARTRSIARLRTTVMSQARREPRPASKRSILRHTATNASCTTSSASSDRATTRSAMARAMPRSGRTARRAPPPGRRGSVRPAGRRTPARRSCDAHQENAGRHVAHHRRCSLSRRRRPGLPPERRARSARAARSASAAGAAPVSSFTVTAVEARNAAWPLATVPPRALGCVHQGRRGPVRTRSRTYRSGGSSSSGIGDSPSSTPMPLALMSTSARASSASMIASCHGRARSSMCRAARAKWATSASAL